MNPKEAIQEYQCSGCVCGPFPDCYEESEEGEGCSRHCAGITIYPVIGRVFLGLPKGFNRLGTCESVTIAIFKSLEDYGEYDKFNIPVWKHLDKHGNTLVKVLSPRLNSVRIHVFLGDQVSQVDCLQITQEDIEHMD